MYGFWTAIAFLGRMPFSSRSCREKSTFSPVFVERLSIRIRSRGTPKPTATSAKISASGRLQHRARERAFVAGEDDERGPAAEEHLGAALGHPRVVAPEDDDAVGLLERVVDVVVVPDDPSVVVDARLRAPIFHQGLVIPSPNLGPAPPLSARVHGEQQPAQHHAEPTRGVTAPSHRGAPNAIA